MSHVCLNETNYLNIFLNRLNSIVFFNTFFSLILIHSSFSFFCLHLHQCHGWFFFFSFNENEIEFESDEKHIFFLNRRNSVYHANHHYLGDKTTINEGLNLPNDTKNKNKIDSCNGHYLHGLIWPNFMSQNSLNCRKNFVHAQFIHRQNYAFTVKWWRATLSVNYLW